MKKVIIIALLYPLLLYSTGYTQEKPYRILNSFSAGELSELLLAREDLSKYHSGCSLMENMFPLPQGGAQKRPGTVYVAESKNNTKIRLLPFEYSTEQSYIIELGNQYARFYTDNAQILGGAGTEDLSGLDSASFNNIIAHWKLNDNSANTAVVDSNGATHDGVASANTEDIHTDGQVGTGCFDLDSQYAVSITDHADFTFVEGTDGDFSLFGWIYVTETGAEQTIISKWDETLGSEAREWKLLLDESRKLKLCVADESLLLESDRVAHWKLNDSADTSAVDDATGSHDGTMDDEGSNYTSTHSVAGKIDNAIEFDGTNDRIAVADHDDFSFGDAVDDSAFSISAWINMDDATDFPILSKYPPNLKEEWRFFVDGNDKLTCELYDDRWDIYIGRKYDTAITAQEGSWIHVVMTYDATEASSGINLYLNGSDVDSADSEAGAYTAMHNDTGVVYIGYSESDADGPHFSEGKIDNVIIFNKELSADDVTNLYNAGSGLENWDSSYPYKTSDDALTTGWRFVAATYEGNHASWSDITAANYITMYVDGAAVDATATNVAAAAYTVMEDTAALPRIGAQESTAGAVENIWADRIDEAAVLGVVLSATEVAGLYDATGAYEMSTPYLTADLFELKYEQSADILYISHPDYETMKLSRLANDDWVLEAIEIENGPFRTQNIDETAKIAASATTGSVTLTATGCAPFVAGTTSGHLPSGSAATSKSQTGALFKLVHPMDTLEYKEELESDFAAGQTEDTSWMDCGVLYKGTTWTLVTGDTWFGTIKVQRNYTIGAAVGNGADEGASLGWETVLAYSSGAGAAVDARNVSTTGTEDDGDAQYRVIYADEIADDTVSVYFSTNQTDHIGIVEITAVASTTSATATVLTTLGSTDATHKWSEGSWSNYRGWPRTVTFFEDRLCFGGNTSQPDTIWASVTADYEDMLEGAEDDDALLFTLSSRQVNVIEWLVGKDKILIGTSGAEWTLGGSADEPLTPSNVKAEQHSSYGSAALQATLAGESVLFFQRGAEKMRELAYNWEADSYVAPDMTILIPEITGDGITDIAFQLTPNAILWCVKENGDLATFVYERKEEITSWSRQTTDGDFESVAVIHGAAEDQVWVSVARVIEDSTVRYIEYFSTRDWGSDDEDAFFVDSGITDTGGSTTVSGLDHLEGETVIVLGDGVPQTEGTSGDFTVSSGDITVPSGLTTVQAGLPYTIQMKTMPLSWVAQGMTIQGRIKRINEVIARYYNSGDFDIGRDTTDKETISISGMDTEEQRVTFPAGYDRPGYVFIYQQSPEPLTLVALMVEFMVY